MPIYTFLAFTLAGVFIPILLTQVVILSKRCKHLQTKLSNTSKEKDNIYKEKDNIYYGLRHALYKAREAINNYRGEHPPTCGSELLLYEKLEGARTFALNLSEGLLSILHEITKLANQEISYNRLLLEDIIEVRDGVIIHPKKKEDANIEPEEDIFGYE